MSRYYRDPRQDVAGVAAASAAHDLELRHGIASEAAAAIMALPMPTIAQVSAILLKEHAGALHIVSRAGIILSDVLRGRREQR